MSTAAGALPKVPELPWSSNTEIESACPWSSFLTSPLFHAGFPHHPRKPTVLTKRRSFLEAKHSQKASSIVLSNAHFSRKPVPRSAPTFRTSTSRVSCIPHALESGSNSSITNEPASLFCFGFGYTTLGLANALRKQGWHVTGTCRSEEKKEVLLARGLPAVVFDTDGEIEGLESDGLAALRSATHLVASIPPVADFDQDPALAFHARQILEAASNQRLRWIGYLSTTGIYGDWDGDWVDESTKPRPSNQRAIARLRAEEAWLALGREAGIPVHIFRLGGIYGPSRSALDAVRSGRAPSQTQRVRESRRFTSRCHVADIVRVVSASIKRPASGGRVYNIVDDDPAPRREVVAYARQLLQKPEDSQRGTESIEESSTSATSTSPREGLSSGPRESSAVGESEESALDGQRIGLAVVDATSETSSARLESNQVLEKEVDTGDGGRGKTRGVDEKRVRNDRIKHELAVTLTFPSYKEGLAAIAGGDMQPFG